MQHLVIAFADGTKISGTMDVTAAVDQNAGELIRTDDKNQTVTYPIFGGRSRVLYTDPDGFEYRVKDYAPNPRRWED
jgi:hypothetical protein